MCFLLNLASSDLLSFPQRLWIYKRFGLNAGDTYIQSHCHFPNLSNITLGDRTFLNHHCFLEGGAAIEIGDDTCLAPGVKVLTTTHEIGDHDRRVGHGCIRKPVKIGKGCWIGAGATILPGVTIGDGVVVGAGALVNRDCEADGLYAGVPARRIKDLNLSGNSTTAIELPLHVISH